MNGRRSRRLRREKKPKPVKQQGPNLPGDLFLKVVDNLNTLGRVYNAAVVGQGLTDGSIDKAALAHEILNSNPDLNLDLLKKENVAGVSEEIFTLVSKIKTACDGVEKPCEGLSAVKDQAASLEAIGMKTPVSLNDALKDRSPLQLLVLIKQIDPKIDNYYKNVEMFLETSEGLRNKTLTQQAASSGIISSMLQIHETSTQLNIQFSAEEVKSLEASNVKIHIDGVLQTEQIATELKSVLIESMKDKLNGLKKIATETRRLYSKEAFEQIQKRFRMLTAISGLPHEKINEKSFTYAFYRGFSDLSKLMLDIESPFMKDVVMSDANHAILKSIIAPLESIRKQIEPVYKSVHNQKITYEHRKNVENVLETVDVEMEGIEKLDGLTECAPKLENFNMTIDSVNWKKEKKLHESLGDGLHVYIANLTSIPQLPEFQKFVNKHYDLKKPLANFLNAIEGDEMKPVLAELATLKVALEKLVSKEVQDWMKATQIDTLVSETKLAIDANTGSALQCLQNKTIFNDVKEFIGIRDNVFQSLRPDDKYIVEIKDAATQLSGAFGAFDKLVNSFKHRKARAVDKPVRIEKGLETTKNLALAFKVYYDLAVVRASETEIQALLNADAAIESAIDKLRNPDKKIKMKKLWSGETKAILKQLPGFVDQLSKKFVSIPNELGDYNQCFNATYFKETKGFDFGGFLNELPTMNLSAPSQEVIEKLRNIDLDFANAQSKMRPGLEAFLLTSSFFAAMNPSKQALASSNQESEIDTIWHVATITAIVFAAVLTIFALLNLFFFVIYWVEFRNKPKKNPKAGRDAWKKLVGRYKWRRGKKNKKEQPTHTTKVYKTAGGHLFVKSTVKDQEMGEAENNTCAPKNISEKNKKLVTEEEEEKEPVEHEEELNEEEKRRAEISKDLAEKQKILVATYKVDPAKKKCIKFKKMTTEEYRDICGTEIKDVPIVESQKKMRFDPPSLDYIVGNTYDKFEEDDLPDGPNFDNDTINKIENRIKELENEQEKLLLEKEDCRTAQIASEVSEKFLKAKVSLTTQATQEDDLNPFREGASGERQHENGYAHGSIGTRWDFTPEQVLEQFKKKVPTEIPDEKTPNGDFSGDYHRHPLLKEDGSIDYHAFVASATRRKMFEHTGIKEGTKYEDVKAPTPLSTAMTIVNETHDRVSGEDVLLRMNRYKTRIIGDIHGGYRDMARHVELGYADRVSTYIFTGDYVDRGPRSIDCVLYLCSLKMSHRTKFYFLRGNHEMALINISGGFYDECIRTYGEKGGTEFWIACNRLFEAMPVACILNNKHWCAHGGVSYLMKDGRGVLDRLRKKPKKSFEWKLLLDILWSDPYEAYPLHDVMSLLFPIGGRSRDINNFTPMGLMMISEKCGFECVFRGHEVPKFGFSPFCANKCITTFGATNNADNNYACHTIVYADMHVEYERMINYDKPSLGKDELTKKSQRKYRRSRSGSPTSKTAPNKK